MIQELMIEIVEVVWKCAGKFGVLEDRFLFN